jgi:hypothetical protein
MAQVAEPSTPNNNELRNKLYNLSLISAEYTEPKILVERGGSVELLEVRPTIHIAQITNFGCLKSTMINRIMKYLSGSRSSHPCHKVSGATAASIAGSISQEGNVTPPLSCQYKHGTVFIDEFKTQTEDKGGAIGCALDILEDESTSRNMARLPKKKIVTEDCEVANGRIRFWNLRSNWMFFTAKNLKKSSELSTAMLLSRTVPVCLKVSYDNLDAIDDHPDLLFRELNLKLPKCETIDKSTNKEIRKFVRNHLEPLGVSENYYDRTVNDVLRCYTMNGYSHDWDLYKFVVDCKISYALSNMEIAEISDLDMSSFLQKES